MNYRSPPILRVVPVVILLFALLFLVFDSLPTADAVEIDADPQEIYQGSETTINISVTSERDEEIRVEVYHGRQEYNGSLLAIKNLTLTAHQEETFPIAFTPYLGQIDLFIYYYATFSGDDLIHLELNGIEHYSDVLLIINNNSDISREIGDHFLSYFDPHVLYVDSPTKETISRAEFDDVRAQIENHLEGNSLTDSINYLVTTKGVPLRVSGDGKAAFDSELTLILGQYASDIGGGSYRYNPWHNSSNRFSRNDHDLYLVTRLTGYTVEEAKGLIDKSVSAYTREGIQELSAGLAIMDVDPGRDGGSYTMGNDWIRAAGTILDAKGYDVMLDKTSTFVRQQEDVSMYASWGSNDGHDFVGHGKNVGLETDGNGDDKPDDWEYSKGNGEMTRTGEDKRGGSWSVRVDRDDPSGESSLLQRFLPETGYRYYLRGYTNTTAVTGSGGVRLVIRHYNGNDDLIAENLGTVRRGTTSAWVALGNCHIEPIAGTEYVKFGVMLEDCEGSAYLDDIQLVEVVPNNSYLDGSLAETIVSTGGRSFNYPTNYGQSLIADIIRSGVTGVKGYCYEPYLDAIAHPNILFDRYTGGWTMAESYYAASIKLSWMDVVVGVPKLAPFVLLPDLALFGQTITQDPGNSYNHTVDITVSNSGGSFSGSWNITFSFSNGTESWNYTLEGTGLHPGESLEFQLNWIAPEAGSYDLNVFIDDHEGHQRERSNDILSTQIIVLSPPDLVPWDHTLDPIVPQENDLFQFILTLKNQGETPAIDVNLSLYIDDSYVTSVFVDAGGLENSFVTFPAEGYLFLIAGFHDFRVVADPEEKIRESNESNNEMEARIRVNALPIPVITGNLTTHVGVPLILDGIQSQDHDGTIQQYVWRVDGRTRVGATLNHTFGDRGSYWVNLTVVDNDDGESISSVLAVVENTPPVPRFELPDPPLLSFDNFTFDARSSYDNDSIALSYSWDFGDGTNATGAIKRKAYLHPGTYPISLTVTDDENVSSTLVREISIGNRPPEIFLAISSIQGIHDPISISGVEIPSHEQVSFLLNGTHDPDGSITECSFTLGDGAHPIIWNRSNITGLVQLPFYRHTYETSGSYMVALVIYDDFRASTTITFNLTFVNEPPLSDFSYIPIKPRTYSPIRLQSSASDNGEIRHYHWDIEGAIHTGRLVDHTFTTYGYYSIIHTVTDDEGATDSWEERIFVMDIPADITGEDIHTEEGKQVRIIWNATDRDGAISYYLVTFEDGTEINQTAKYLDHVFPQAGTYRLNVTVVDDYGLSNSIIITVYVEKASDDGGLISIPQPFMAIVGAIGVMAFVKRRRR